MHLVAAQEQAALNARAEFLAVEAVKLMAVALRHKPSSPAATACASSLKPAAVIRGLTSAVSLRVGKVRSLGPAFCMAPYAQAPPPGEAPDRALQAGGGVHPGAPAPVPGAEAGHA